MEHSHKWIPHFQSFSTSNCYYVDSFVLHMWGMACLALYVCILHNRMFLNLGRNLKMWMFWKKEEDNAHRNALHWAKKLYIASTWRSFNVEIAVNQTFRASNWLRMTLYCSTTWPRHKWRQITMQIFDHVLRENTKNDNEQLCAFVHHVQHQWRTILQSFCVQEFVRGHPQIQTIAIHFYADADAGSNAVGTW